MALERRNAGSILARAFYCRDSCMFKCCSRSVRNRAGANFCVDRCGVLRKLSTILIFAIDMAGFQA